MDPNHGMCATAFRRRFIRMYVAGAIKIDIEASPMIAGGSGRGGGGALTVTAP